MIKVKIKGHIATEKTFEIVGPATSEANKKRQMRSLRKQNETEDNILKKSLSRKKNENKAQMQSRAFLEKTKISLTADQIVEKERIQRRGFHEGAKIPGSNLRKIDK